MDIARPGRPRAARGQLRGAAVVALLGLEIFAGQLSIRLAPPGSELAAYWPSSGISIIALCLAAPRWRPAVLAGIFAVTVPANLLGGRALDVSVAFSLLNTVEAAVVIAVLTSGGRLRPALESLEDFLRLLFATVVGGLVAGLLGGVIVEALDTGQFWVTARALATSHAAAMLLLSPLAMRLPRKRVRRCGLLEQLVQWSALLTVATLVFAPGQGLPLVFAPFPFLVWGATRLPVREVTLQVLTTAVLVSALTTAGHGPFTGAVIEAGLPPETVGTLLQATVLAMAAVTVPLALVRTHRLIVIDEVVHSHDTLSNIMAATTGTSILGTDLDGRIEFFNVGAEQLTGYRAEEVLGAADVTLVPDHDRFTLTVSRFRSTGADPLRRLVEPFLIRAGGTGTADWSFVRRDGDLRTIAVTLSRRHDATKEPIGYLIVAEDVTDHRVNELMVKAALEAEKQIVERLAQVDRTKNDFMATVSHELRTPITSIIGYSQLLLSQASTESDPDDALATAAMQQQVLGRIERNGRRLMGLIEDMLTMSQVELGDFRFHKVPLDLRDPVHAALTAVAPLQAEARVEVEARLAEEAVKVYGDSDKLERVFANLISNAVKFSHAGDRVVVALSAAEGKAWLSVTDAGIGISAEDQTHLFDRFFRGADAHARAIQGAGLGLSIASSIVAGHQGEIHVDSAPGRGSTFRVQLPLMLLDEPL